MTIKKRLTSFSYAKELKKLGYTQKGLWYIDENKNYYILLSNDHLLDIKQETVTNFEYFKRNKIELYVTPTIEELVAQLPPNISCCKIIDNATFDNDKFCYICKSDEFYKGLPFFTEKKTLANAYAVAWISFKKQKLI